MRRYANVNDMLPPELVEQVLKHCSGLYLWVPSLRRAKQRHRAEYIVHLRYDQRMAIEEIAEKMNLSGRRVYEILAAHRYRHPDDVRT